MRVPHLFPSVTESETEAREKIAYEEDDKNDLSGLGRLHLLDHFPELFQGDVLNLAHTLAGDAKFLADFFEGLLRTAVQPEAGAQDRGFTGIERLDHFLEHASDGLLLELLVRSVGA